MNSISKERKKLLFLYSKAGGGHYSASKNIVDYIEKNEPNVVTDLVNGLGFAPRWFENSITKKYLWIVNNLSILFSFVYFLGKFKPFSCLFISVVNLFVQKNLKEYILKTNPDKMVCTFYFTKVVDKIIEKNNLNIELYTVISDSFTFPNVWACSKSGKFVVQSEFAKDRLIKKHGVRKEGVKVFNSLASQEYSNELSTPRKKQIAKSLGLEDKFTVFAYGGGLGLSNSYKIAKEVVDKGLDINLIIVCGYNQELYNSIKSLIEERNVVNIKVFGFVNQSAIYSYLNISNFVITKAGPSSISEILCLKKPMVINQYLWEQEKGNVDFVINNKVGYYEKNPIKVFSLLEKVAKNNKELYKIENNLKKLDWKNEISSLVKFLLK